MPREKKTEIITLRVTPRTKAVIQARAKSVNKTVTDYLCLCGLGKEIVQVETCSCARTYSQCGIPGRVRSS